jgi:hypothetical protein
MLEQREAVDSQIDRRIHCVLLFVPQQAMENAEHLQVLQEAHERIAKLVPNPIIVLTKLGREVDESLRCDAGAQNEVVKSAMQLAYGSNQIQRAHQSGLPLGQLRRRDREGVSPREAPLSHFGQGTRRRHAQLSKYVAAAHQCKQQQ